MLAKRMDCSWDLGFRFRFAFESPVGFYRNTGFAAGHDDAKSNFTRPALIFAAPSFKRALPDYNPRRAISARTAPSAQKERRTPSFLAVSRHQCIWVINVPQLVKLPRWPEMFSLAV